MENGVKALGKINPQTGMVTELPTALNYDNCVMNSGGAIDPVNLVYYFQTLDTTSQIKMVGLSLLDGSVVSESYISSNGNYFIMYRIQNDCYDANPSRLNPIASLAENNTINIQKTNDIVIGNLKRNHNKLEKDYLGDVFKNIQVQKLLIAIFLGLSVSFVALPK